MHIRHFASSRVSNHIGVTTIERLDQGHLYPLGERRDKHVTGGARTSALLETRQTLYLKSYPGFRIRIRIQIWIRINLSCWIRIRILIQIADPDPDPGGGK